MLDDGVVDLEARKAKARGMVVPIGKARQRKKATPRIEGLHLTKQGDVEASAANTATILIRDEAWLDVLEYDERTGAIRFATKPPLPPDLCNPLGPWPRDVADANLVGVQQWIRAAYGTAPGLRTIADAVAAAARHRTRDFVREYLDGLVWDGEARLETWLHRYCAAEANAYTAGVGRRWLVAAVARTYEPGCQADHVLVLEGAQGIGKSSLLRTLACEPAWFTDAPLDFRNKDAADALQGPWLVELAELDSFQRAELATIKAFVSRQVDRYRGAYARMTANRPRRCVFAGSTNESAYLRDPTGARRFWPVRCGARLDCEALVLARDQLWAEAVHAYRAGVAWWPDESAAALAAGEQERRYQGDEWEGIVSGFIDGRDEVTVREVADGALKIDAARLDGGAQKRIVAALQRLGWRSTGNPVWRVLDGKRARVRVYEPPRGAARDAAPAVVARGDDFGGEALA